MASKTTRRNNLREFHRAILPALIAGIGPVQEHTPFHYTLRGDDGFLLQLYPSTMKIATREQTYGCRTGENLLTTVRQLYAEHMESSK